MKSTQPRLPNLMRLFERHSLAALLFSAHFPGAVKRTKKELDCISRFRILLPHSVDERQIKHLGCFVDSVFFFFLLSPLWNCSLRSLRKNCPIYPRAGGSNLSLPLFLPPGSAPSILLQIPAALKRTSLSARHKSSPQIEEPRLLSSGRQEEKHFQKSQWQIDRIWTGEYTSLISPDWCSGILGCSHCKKCAIHHNADDLCFLLSLGKRKKL